MKLINFVIFIILIILILILELNINEKFYMKQITNNKDPNSYIYSNTMKFTLIKNSKGATSDIYISNNKKYIKKKIKNYKEYDILKREIYILKLLNKYNYDWAPKLISFNDDYIIMSYCGEEINHNNIPEDYKNQINIILNDLKRHNIKHNDIKIEEILVKDGKIYLCDFGWASISNDFSLGNRVDNRKKKFQIYKDSNIIHKIDKIYKNKTKSICKEMFINNKNNIIELHIIIDWKQKYDKIYILDKLKYYNLTLYKFIEHNKLHNKAQIMSKFYNIKIDDYRGSQKFNIYLLYDYNPKYDFRNSSKGRRLVNTKVFDLKKKLRNNDYSIHGTDNIQETKDNLIALKIFDKYYKQKQFDSLSHVFDVLNNSKLKWVVMRNFEDMPNNILIDEHLDVDLLVNDYYLIKRLLDASSATNNRYEDGKYRILNYVIINNKKVLFDFRCIGDNYYDINFQKSILDTRVKYKNFYIPNNKNHLYSLIYHAIIHKNKISNTYKKIFLENNISYDKNNLKKLLDIFMIENNYSYVKPEPSVGFNYTYV